MQQLIVGSHKEIGMNGILEPRPPFDDMIKTPNSLKIDMAVSKIHIHRQTWQNFMGDLGTHLSV